MKLKCIGGERDGELWEVDKNRYRIHDSIRVAPRISSVSVFPINLDVIPVITETYLIYRLEKIQIAEEELWFLVTEYPVRWSAKEAIRHQFTK